MTHRKQILLHAVLTLGGLLMLFPFIWMLLTSFKGVGQMINDPLAWLPVPWRPRNYPDVLAEVPLGQAYWNSMYIAAVTVAATLFTGAMAAYAFARIPFRGSGPLFGLFLATQMVPAQVTVVPLYIMLAELQLIDSHLALILPAIANPFAVFLLRQFIRAVPVELEDAARIDGAAAGPSSGGSSCPTSGPACGRSASSSSWPAGTATSSRWCS
ncbi:carbohydrate ABC transporter permease [Kitasatospora gansuensis]